MTTVKTTTEAIGRTKLGVRLGVGNTAIGNAVTRGLFPAAWYPVVKELSIAAGIGEPPENLFNFKSNPTPTPQRGAE